jgi:2,4-dienoyl-CoA reductase (NADPH2)
MAKRIPGKEEFHETQRYVRRRIEVTGVRLSLGRRITAAELAIGGYDEVVLATGVTPRDPRIEGDDEHRASGRVISYVDLLLNGRPAGQRVAVVGAGGIGFDVSEYLVSEGHSTTLDTAAWLREWGVADPAVARGGLGKPEIAPPSRKVYLLQRKAAPLGKGLGKTTGWIHRAALRMKRVEMIGGVNYERIDERGLHVSFGEAHEKPMLIEVDTVVLCAGQEPARELAAPLREQGVNVHLIGGADVATELDAKRAIEQGTRLAAAL